MSLQVDQNLCIGCGTCVSMCDQCFELKEGKSQVKSGCDEATCGCELDEVIAACSVSAISK